MQPSHIEAIHKLETKLLELEENLKAESEGANRDFLLKSMRVEILKCKVDIQIIKEKTVKLQ
jgi:hypothetical protein